MLDGDGELLDGWSGAFDGDRGVVVVAGGFAGGELVGGETVIDKLAEGGGLDGEAPSGVAREWFSPFCRPLDMS